MKPPRIPRKALIQLSFLLALLTVGFVCAAIVLAESSLHVVHNRDGVPPVPSAQNLELTTPDGATLRAWLFLPKAPHPDYVILLHGVGASRPSFPSAIRLLLRHNYAVLAPDSRGHGDSTGGLVTYGLREAPDVHLWADLLYRTQPVQNLFGLGESMGAAVLLQSLAVEPRFQAVVAECPFASFDEIARDRILQTLGSGGPAARAIAVSLESTALLYTRLRYRIDLTQASPIAVVRRTQVPILLIHGLRDTNIPPQHSRELLLANPRRITPWFVPRARHTDAISAEPEAFEQRVTSFYELHRR